MNNHRITNTLQWTFTTNPAIRPSGIASRIGYLRCWRIKPFVPADDPRSLAGEGHGRADCLDELHNGVLGQVSGDVGFGDDSDQAVL